MTRFRRISLAIAVLVVLLVPAAPAGARGPHAIKVMTRNQYLGADLTPVILAQSLQEFVDEAKEALTQVAANNFPRRAKGFAREVFLTRPDVIGLQEVFNFTVNGVNSGPPFVDHLAETRNALEAAGLHYVVAGSITHLDVTVPLDINGDTIPELVRVVDRDVILVKAGLPFTTLAGDAPAGLCGVLVSVPSLPDLQSTPFEDGCTYTVVAVVGDSPVGPIVVNRGFLGVDVKVAGKTYRVVNTHLEVKQLAPIVQFLQAVELAGTLAATTPPDRTLIALGDFNSSPLDEPLGGILPPYQVLVDPPLGFPDAGLEDAWISNVLAPLDPNGFTCCQPAELTNTSSMLNERIDLILVREAGWFESFAVVTGRVRLLPIATPPNWASDHAGVFGTLFFGP
jgi:endonuclease/exonuclease/phosphatase family metal-dependent hydrolase